MHFLLGALRVKHKICVTIMNTPTEMNILTLYLIEMPFNKSANRADPDHAVLERAA